MKKLMTVLAVSLVGTFAMAAEVTAADLSTPAGVEMATADGAPVCRTGTVPAPKYCRSNDGWVQCGWQCVYDPYTGGM